MVLDSLKQRIEDILDAHMLGDFEKKEKVLKLLGDLEKTHIIKLYEELEKIYEHAKEASEADDLDNLKFEWWMGYLFALRDVGVKGAIELLGVEKKKDTVQEMLDAEEKHRRRRLRK